MTEHRPECNLRKIPIEIASCTCHMTTKPEYHKPILEPTIQEYLADPEKYPNVKLEISTTKPTAEVSVEETFIDKVWDVLKGDHSDLRKQQIILGLYREALQAHTTALKGRVVEECDRQHKIYDINDKPHIPLEDIKLAITNIN